MRAPVPCHNVACILYFFADILHSLCTMQSNSQHMATKPTHTSRSCSFLLRSRSITSSASLFSALRHKWTEATAHQETARSTDYVWKWHLDASKSTATEDFSSRASLASICMVRRQTSPPDTLPHQSAPLLHLCVPPRRFSLARASATCPRGAPSGTGEVNGVQRSDTQNTVPKTSGQRFAVFFPPVPT